MLTINGKQFAKNDKEFISTLFSGKPKTAYGYYKVVKNGIKLLNHQRKPWMFIVNNKHGEQFVVSCSEHNGKIRYMFALSTNDEKLIGFDKLSYLEQSQAIKNCINSIILVKQ